MSLALYLDPDSVRETEDYLAEMRQRILGAIRSAMWEAMEGLAWKVADKFQGNPIISRSGHLLGNILESPQVTETAEIIRGTVSTDVFKDQKHVGLWLEEGVHIPAVTAKLFQFTPPGGETMYTRGHRAFDIKPHAFMNPSLREYETKITQIIADAVEGVLTA